MENFPSITDHLLAILFGAVLPIVSGWQSRAMFKYNALMFTSTVKIRFYLNNSLVLGMSAASIAVNWLLQGRDFSRLGMQPIDATDTRILFLFTTLFLLLYALDLWTTFGNKVDRSGKIRETAAKAPFLPLHKKEFPAYFIMCCTAAFCEEWIYRGYLVTYFQAAFRNIPVSTTLAVLAPALLFSVAHLYQGIKAVFKIMVLSTLFGILFIKSGSLLIVSLLHFIVDWCSGLLYAYVAKTENQKEQ